MSFIFYVFDPFDVLDVFGRQVLLCWLVALPAVVTIPPLVLTSVMALTFRETEARFSLSAVSHTSDPSRGRFQPLISSPLNTLSLGQASYGLLGQ